MPNKEDIDIEILELGAALSLYSVSLAAIMGVMKNEEDSTYILKMVNLGNERANELKSALIRCNLPSFDIKLASDFKNAVEIGEYLFTNPFPQDISNHVVGKWGRRQEAILRFAIRISEGIAALKFNHQYTPDIKELKALGARFGLPDENINRWVKSPETALNEFREYIKRSINKNTINSVDSYDYSFNIDNNQSWDVFISHASEDKDSFVRDLANKLMSKNIKVWYDEFSLKLGDSLRRSIDYGLSHSRFGIVIISPNFLKKEWPQRELDGLVSREISGRKVILPIWHNVDFQTVCKYSPTLADRLATNSSKGLNKVVDDVMEIIGSPDNHQLVKADVESEFSTANSEFEENETFKSNDIEGLLDVTNKASNIFMGEMVKRISEEVEYLLQSGIDKKKALQEVRNTMTKEIEELDNKYNSLKESEEKSGENRFLSIFNLGAKLALNSLEKLQKDVEHMIRIEKPPELILKMISDTMNRWKND